MNHTHLIMTNMTGDVLVNQPHSLWSRDQHRLSLPVLIAPGSEGVIGGRMCKNNPKNLLLDCHSVLSDHAKFPYPPIHNAASDTVLDLTTRGCYSHSFF